MSEVMFVKLSNGEEFIATVDENGSKYMIENPVALVPSQDGKFMFVPWSPFSESRQFNIPVDSVMFINPAKTDVAEEYGRMFGKIITTGPKLIVD